MSYAWQGLCLFYSLRRLVQNSGRVQPRHVCSRPRCQTGGVLETMAHAPSACWDLPLAADTVVTAYAPARDEQDDALALQQLNVDRPLI